MICLVLRNFCLARWSISVSYTHLAAADVEEFKAGQELHAFYGAEGRLVFRQTPDFFYVLHVGVEMCIRDSP